MVSAGVIFQRGASGGLDLSGVPVTIFGLGREGVDLAHYLARAGARLRVTDKRSEEELRPAMMAVEELPIEWSLGGHSERDVDGREIVFVSPGVPWHLPILETARRRGVPVTSATDLFLSLCPAPVVGITGSSGKTTTASLVGAMLREAGKQVIVGGNIGTPLLRTLPELSPQHWVVMELSSFQLETVERSPHVAAVLNVTPNHLDRHSDMVAYASCKANILRFQQPEDWAVLNADDAVARAMATRARVHQFSLEGPAEGAHLKGDSLVLRLSGRESLVCRTSDIHLRGRHNVANVLAAATLAAAAGADPSAMRRAIQAFGPVAHRLQPVGCVNGVWFYDDSIATSPERSVAALRSFEEPVVLIAGGRDKHLPMDEWARAMCAKVKHVVLLGEAAPKIAVALSGAGPGAPPRHFVRSMREAVRSALGLAEAGDVVLMSPGCTSYDMFRDFEERGEVFAQAVRALSG